MLFIQNF